MPETVQNVKGHNNFYPKVLKGEDEIDREFTLYMYEPDDEINEDTGILLLIAGFGGHSNSNVYKKMRRIFANKYNLITIQCDYFGFEFMQSEIKEESIYNFCDMSFLQAMDNIYATLYAIDYAMSKSDKINSKKIIIYGNSHGAYLAHLCNSYSGIFTHILDNSSWLYPKYLSHYRRIIKEDNILNIKYLASEVLGNNNPFLKLLFLYENFKNTCVIKSYHVIDDELIKYEDKEKIFVGGYINCLELIKISTPDNNVFFSTKHSLGADYLKIFELFYNNLYFEKDYRFNIIDEIIYEYDNIQLNIDYSQLLPIITFKKIRSI